MKNILKSLCLLSCLMACEKVVDIDVPFEPSKLVVNSILNPDSIFSVQLSKSQYILDNAPIKDIEDAELWIFEGEELLGKPQHTKGGFYTLEGVKPKIGKTYTIRATNGNMESVQGSETVLPPPVISGGRVDTLNIENYKLDLSLEFEIQDPAPGRNFYMISIFEERQGYRYNRHNDEEPEKVEFWNEMYFSSHDPSIENICYGRCVMLLSDDFFNGKSYKVKLSGESYNYNFQRPGDNEEVKKPEIYLVVVNISESAYLYYKTFVINDEASENPFAEPGQVFSNIDGGYGVVVSQTPVAVHLTP